MILSSGTRIGLFGRIMLAFLVVIVAGGLLATWLARRTVASQFALYTTTGGQRLAQGLVPDLAAYYIERGSWEGVTEVLSSSAGHGMMDNMGMGIGGPMLSMMGYRVLVIDTSGRVVADTGGDMASTQVDTSVLQENGTFITDGEEVIGAVLVTADVQAEEQGERFLGVMNRAILFSVFLAGALALVFGGLIVWRVVRPLKNLTMAASAVAAGDLSQRVSVPPGDEISDLADAFNRMAVQLDRAEVLRQQLTADIAHELRTPITVIQGNIEALQDGIFPLTQEALEPILDKTLLLRRLVEDLRQLALAESGQLSLIPEPLDLGHLADQALDAFRPSAEARGVELSLIPADNLPLVRADRQRVQQVLDNLLSNALRYTPDGGRITVGLARENESIRVTMTDTGPGIPVEVLPNVFERFYRADQSRERLSDGGGSGLGLAVARSIIEAHGGRIDVKSLPGEGATFWFSLPVDVPEGTK